MKLSVCMIVKNEEKTICRILDCIKQFADEIIICDTGSNDKTKKLCEQYTKHIFDFAWINDFSKARNFSFSKATGDYIMWLDADDYITQENINKIKLLKKQLNNNINIYMLKYCLKENNTTNFTFSYYRERIIKNSPINIWNGFLHESIALIGKYEFCDIDIEHRKEKLGDPKRNLKIYNYYKKNKTIFSTREQYYYSKELFYNGYYKKCIQEMKKYLNMKNKYYPNNIDAILTLSKCYLHFNDLDNAQSILLCNLSKLNPTSEYLCELANIFKLKNNTEMAILFYKSALNIKPKYNEGFFVDNNYYYYIPMINLCILLYGDNYKESKMYHNMLVDNYPNDHYIIYNKQFFNNK